MGGFVIVFCMWTVDILAVLKNLWTKDNPSNILPSSQGDDSQPILNGECACVAMVVYFVKCLVMFLPIDFMKLINYLNKTLTLIISDQGEVRKAESPGKFQFGK